MVRKYLKRLNENASHKLKLFEKGKTLILAYDQGFEHGPVDFNLKNVDPAYIMDLALEGRYNAVAVQAGIAEKYHVAHFKDIPLIVKLNGKTRFDNEDPVSLQHTSVSHAAKLGAIGVGYTLYLGSTKEQDMFREFGRICEEAHELGMLSICWMYPRGPHIKDEFDTDTLAYGARIAMELGADVVKIKHKDDVEAMKWVVKSAGRTKVVIAGGSKTSDLEFLKIAEQVLNAGVVGLAVGRNIWQSDNPLNLTKALKDVVFNGKSAEEAYSEMGK